MSEQWTDEFGRRVIARAEAIERAKVISKPVESFNATASAATSAKEQWDNLVKSLMSEHGIDRQRAATMAKKNNRHLLARMKVEANQQPARRGVW